MAAAPDGRRLGTQLGGPIGRKLEKALGAAAVGGTRRTPALAERCALAGQFNPMLSANIAEVAGIEREHCASEDVRVLYNGTEYRVHKAHGVLAPSPLHRPVGSGSVGVVVQQRRFVIARQPIEILPCLQSRTKPATAGRRATSPASCKPSWPVDDWSPLACAKRGGSLYQQARHSAWSASGKIFFGVATVAEALPRGAFPSTGQVAAAPMTVFAPACQARRRSRCPFSIRPPGRCCTCMSELQRWNRALRHRDCRATSTCRRSCH